LNTNISQISVATHLGCGGIYWKFTNESASERNMKIS